MHAGRDLESGAATRALLPVPHLHAELQKRRAAARAAARRVPVGVFSPSHQIHRRRRGLAHEQTCPSKSHRVLAVDGRPRIAETCLSPAAAQGARGARVGDCFFSEGSARRRQQFPRRSRAVVSAAGSVWIFVRMSWVLLYWIFAV